MPSIITKGVRVRASVGPLQEGSDGVRKSRSSFHGTVLGSADRDVGSAGQNVRDKLWRVYWDELSMTGDHNSRTLKVIYSDVNREPLDDRLIASLAEMTAHIGGHQYVLKYTKHGFSLPPQSPSLIPFNADRQTLTRPQTTAHARTNVTDTIANVRSERGPSIAASGVLASTEDGNISESNANHEFPPASEPNTTGTTATQSTGTTATQSTTTTANDTAAVIAAADTPTDDNVVTPPIAHVENSAAEENPDDEVCA